MNLSECYDFVYATRAAVPVGSVGCQREGMEINEEAL